jgi:hypothetical protein
MLLMPSMRITGYRVAASFSIDRIVPHILKKMIEMPMIFSKNSNITGNFDPLIIQHKAKDVMTEDIVATPIRIKWTDRDGGNGCSTVMIPDVYAIAKMRALSQLLHLQLV